MIKALFGNPLRFMEFIGICLFLLMVVTQIAIPLIRDLPLFPILSRKPRIIKDIARVNEEASETSLELDLKAKREQLEALKKRKDNPTPPPDEPTQTAFRQPPRPPRPSRPVSATPPNRTTVVKR